MITTAQMYWITRLDAIVSFGICLNVFAFIVFLIGLFVITIVSDSPNDPVVKPMFKRLVKWTLTFLLLGVFVCMFVPTTKEMAAIIVVPKIANSEKVQQAGNKLYDLAVEWMDALKTQHGKETK